jgi:hypothetical protein
MTLALNAPVVLGVPLYATCGCDVGWLLVGGPLGVAAADALPLLLGLLELEETAVDDAVLGAPRDTGKAASRGRRVDLISIVSRNFATHSNGFQDVKKKFHPAGGR